MEIIVLGSGTAVPDGRRGSPGLAVNVEGTRMFLDLGSGSLYRAARYGFPVEGVDAILFTHMHPDHTADLVPLLFAFQNPEWSREEELLLFGPKGFPNFLGDLEEIYGDWISALGYPRKVVTMENSRVKNTKKSAVNARGSVYPNHGRAR